MVAQAVLYVGDLDRMHAFYARCFGLTVADQGRGYVGLSSRSWLLTLVASDLALPTTSPPPRREETPIKLAFDVTSIEALRPVIASLGGQVSPHDAEWEFRAALHCDCLDPEGNVVQLVQSEHS